jgi:hypothetical protein
MKRLISNSIALRVVYITNDMRRALKLGSMYPKSPSGRRDTVCTINMVTTAERSISISCDHDDQQIQLHVSPPLVDRLRGFGSAVGADADDSIAFAIGHAAGCLTMAIEKSKRPKLNKC